MVTVTDDDYLALHCERFALLPNGLRRPKAVVAAASGDVAPTPLVLRDLLSFTET
jgi:hypothetical protein